MAFSEKEVREKLDKLLAKAKTIEDLNELMFRIDDSIEEGYDVRDFIPKYNALVQKFYSGNTLKNKK